jgi:2-dehydropantoate 2-reductase|tara:strand:- start:97 stop:981 length:885 start_codon:yes stop_codon:yes gene_type:complete
MKVAILGNGAIGNLLVLKCYQIKQDVGVFMRSQQHFTLTATDIGHQAHQINIDSLARASLSEFNLLIIPVKAYQVVNALKQLQTDLTPVQTIVLLHNGMGVIESAKALLPDNPIIAATTSHAAYKPDAQSVTETGLGVCHLGYLQHPGAIDSEQIHNILNRLLGPCTWHEKIEQALWDKLAINAAINPLTAIHRVNNGQLTELKYRADIESICAETVSVMTASGFHADKSELVEKVLSVANATATNYSSMYQDIAHHRLSEIAFINGYICQEAQKQGLDVPFNTELVNKINALA